VAIKRTVVVQQRYWGVDWSIGKTAGSSNPLRETFQQLERAELLRMQGQVERARAICEGLVGRYPDYFGALYTLGLIYIDKKQYPQALGYLVRAAMLNPQSWRALTALSAVYLELGAYEMAAHTLEQASRIEPEDASILVTLGEVYREEREYELARDAFANAFRLDPSLHVAAIGLGTCYAHLGQYAEAAKVFEGVVKRGVNSPEVLAQLIDLPSSFVTIDVLAQLNMLTRKEDEDKTEFETSVAFVRAAALDRVGRHSEAWDQLVRANSALYLAKQREADDLLGTQQANLAQLKEKEVRAKGTDPSPRTISLFILGPSRSGKTIMESLVATLDGVKRGYENPSVERAICRTFQSAGLLTAGMFEALPPTLDSYCCDLYAKELARRAGSANVFTNTHPVRIHDAARVAAAFPNVRFIFVKRNLDDNMLRIFMRKYLSGNPYAYDLKSIRDHLIWYHQMIDVLAEKLPNIARVILYEDMVTDPLAARQVAADLCGLSVSQRPLPAIGDDRGCAAPYRKMMAAALEC
jgi:tetratricopeptide (TPR) repeat protein